MALSKNDTAIQLGCNIAVDLFVEMLNPSNRGPNLTWDSLREYVARRAETSVGFDMICRPNERARLGKIAAKSAREQYDRMLVESGVESWLKLPVL